MTEQPYSDKAMLALARGLNATGRGIPDPSLRRGAGAMHDREALGLDASVCARTFLDEIATKLRRGLIGTAAPSIQAMLADDLLREFGGES
jgi:hypothetical protein